MTDPQMPEPLVRPATASDLPTLGRLGALLVQEHQDFDPRRFLGVTADTSTHYGSFLGEQLADPNALNSRNGRVWFRKERTLVTGA